MGILSHGPSHVVAKRLVFEPTRVGTTLFSLIHFSLFWTSQWTLKVSLAEILLSDTISLMSVLLKYLKWTQIASVASASKSIAKYHNRVCGYWTLCKWRPLALPWSALIMMAGTNTASKHITFLQSQWKHWMNVLCPTLRHGCVISSFWTPASQGSATPNTPKLPLQLPKDQFGGHAQQPLSFSPLGWAVTTQRWQQLRAYLTT